jgi:hypothetical protein
MVNRAKLDSAKKGRKPDWKKKTESRIGVPYDLAQSVQKKALVKIWEALKEAELDFTDLAIFAEYGIHLIAARSAAPEKRLCRKYSTAVAASFGVTSASEADSGGYEDIDLFCELIQEPDRTILLEVIGNSMCDDGILPGSLLVVETCNNHSEAWLAPKDRQYVIALVNDTHLTVKQFRRFEHSCYLVPRNRKNSQHQPILIKEADGDDGELVEIVGIVRSVTQKLY